MSAGPGELHGVHASERALRTVDGVAVRDITADVSTSVAASGVRDGIACVYSPRTTCFVRVTELESGLLEDLAAMLRRLVPLELAFDDARARCLALLLGSAGESIPVRNGALSLGTWQRLLLVDLDPDGGGDRDRDWLVQVVGE